MNRCWDPVGVERPQACWEHFMLLKAQSTEKRARRHSSSLSCILYIKLWSTVSQHSTSLNNTKCSQQFPLHSFPFSNISLPLPPYWFSFRHPAIEIKGNRVEIPDSPAAVSFSTTFGQIPLPLSAHVWREGVRTEVSQKTCQYVAYRPYSRGFRGGHLHYIFTVLLKTPGMKTGRRYCRMWPQYRDAVVIWRTWPCRILPVFFYTKENHRPAKPVVWQ